MEVNKDESERCVDIALEAIRNGNVERAEKFLRKADNLFPNQRAKNLLAQLNDTKKSSGSGPRRRPTKPRDPSAGRAETQEARDYTPEQLEIVKRVKRCKDFYEILSVTKESTDSEIKKAYKKLALQLHPDKNHAPGAVEAFKAVGNAVAVLTDAEKRKTYDVYGEEGNKINNHRHQYHANHEYEHAYRFDSDFTAEELFNMFFGNGFPQQRNPPGRRYNQEADNQQQQNQPSLAFGIILVLILVSMMSSFFTSDPIYSLSQTSKYTVLRKTIHLNIPYYVKDKFESEYQGSLARLENSVEEEYIIVMKQNCHRERTYREMMMQRARHLNSHIQFEQASQIKVTSCENLARIGLTKFMPY